ncbi:thiol peroxidase [Psychroserpens luteolus]|uniref:thiol peroxidase n=1 Tax=Psychroserpens luteolus TaxID=2855840 RepID=UPI001E39E308|nr:thiol peroxidase [Psychroserpens luteolus]MCD2259554.1 thiol peroxidase [Psychroserpens luteolus]
MATVTLGGDTVHTSGTLPNVGSKAPDFKLTATDLSSKSLNDYAGHKLVLNVFPSVDTETCAQSIREFNKEASNLDNTKVLCISKDLPFAMARFCGAEGLDNVVSLSDFRTGDFGKSYGLDFTDGAFEALLSRCVIVVDSQGTVTYTEQVPEIADEPNYKAALEALK